MIDLKNAILSGATVFAAGFTGHVMQSSPVADMRYPAETPLQTQDHIPPSNQVTAGPFSGITDLELTSVAFTSATVTGPALPGLDQDPIAPMRDLVADAKDKFQIKAEARPLAVPVVSASVTGATPCTAALDARPMAAAMVQLNLIAGCQPDTRVTLHHNGMMITESTDSKGGLTLQMPALSQTAVFMAAFENGVTAMAKADVTSLDVYDRVVVQWEGPGDMQIHAFEFGADYTEEGHVWKAAPREAAEAALGRGGFLTELGKAMPDQDLRAQVYTFPSGTVSRSGDVALSIETEVTAETCNRRMEAQTLQLTGGGALSVKDLTLDMPDCDAVGDFLVLKNLLQDLKIAQN
ncbi:MAG: hypothetical protein NWR54_00955 [Paracoccaceae bacterium]|nr:hypothetical protein [Paracoccaceae bacterium]